MNAKQEAFVREYLIDLNATQAAIRAGYSKRTAYSQGQRLLKHDEVQAAVTAGQAQRATRTQITADFVIGGLREVAQRCMQRVPVMVGRGDDRRQATVIKEDPATGELREEGVWEFDSSGANRSLELLGKHLGIFRDAPEGGEAPAPVKVEVVVKDGRRGG